MENEQFIRKLKNRKIYYTTEYIDLLNYINFDPIIKKAEDLTQEKMNKTLLISDLERYVVDHLREKLVKMDNVFYSRSEISGFTKLMSVDDETFTSFLEAAIEDLVYGEHVDKTCKKVLKRLSVSSYANVVIQFDDCYIDNDRVFPGFYLRSIPRTRIPRKVYHIFQGSKPQKVEVVDDFIKHLANEDEETADRLITSLSVCFLNTPVKRQVLAEMIQFYGPTAENGKSTLLEFLKRTFGASNISSFDISKLKGYELEHATQYFIAFDADASGSFLKQDSTSNIKKIVTGDELIVRKIYGSPVNITPVTTLIVATNNMPKLEDKSNGYLRRQTWYHIKNKLIKPSEWFDTLKSEDASQYLIELIFERYLEIVRENEKRPLTKAMQETTSMFLSKNNNVIEFILSQDFENDVVFNTVARIKEEYEKWCEMNGETPLGSTKFNQIVESEFNLKRSSIVAKKIKNLDNPHLIINPNKKVKTWVKS